MNIPIKLRVESTTQRRPGGFDYIRLTGEALSSGTIFEVEVNRAALAEVLAFDAREGLTVPANLKACEGWNEPQHQDAEREDNTRTIRI